MATLANGRVSPVRYDLKIFLFLAQVAILFSQAECSDEFGRGHHEQHFCLMNIEFGPMVQEEMPFKDISYLELWWNHLSNFCSRQYGEHSSEINLNLGQWLRRWLL